MKNKRDTGQTIETRVQSIDRLNESVVRLRLTTVDAIPLLYREGQYVSIQLSNGVTRSYSLASALDASGTLELHIQLRPRGMFSEALRRTVQVGDRLNVAGPYGNCIWQEPDQKDAQVIMLATGTGIAPVKALLEALLQSDRESDYLISLYWGGRNESDLYLADHFRAIAQRYARFHFFPVLSEAVSTEDRYVQHVASRRHPDLSSAVVYACGAPAMVSSAYALLTSHNRLADSCFWADAFQSTGTEKERGSDQSGPVTIHLKSGDGAHREMKIECGTHLMASLRDAGLMAGICGGHASCGTCLISIDPLWTGSLPAAQRNERRLLSALRQAGPTDRLACQIPVSHEISGLLCSVPIND